MWRERPASALRPAAQALAVFLLSCADPALAAGPPPAVTQVESIAMTVSDMERAVDFYTRVLTFEKVTDREVSGGSYEHLWGVFGLRVRAVRLRLGQPAAFELSLTEAHWQLISRATELPQAELGWHSGLITRDPDGHASLIGAGAACTRI